MKGTIKSADELSLLFKTARKHTATNLIILEARPNRLRDGAVGGCPPAGRSHNRARCQQQASGAEQAPQRAPQQGRVAFVAGKRLGSAPRRNRAKRLMREAARLLGIPQDGHDRVFIARQQTTKATLDAVMRDMERLLRRDGWREQPIKTSRR
jgi:ribonuclease P protein component